MKQQQFLPFDLQVVYNYILFSDCFLFKVLHDNDITLGGTCEHSFIFVYLYIYIKHSAGSLMQMSISGLRNAPWSIKKNTLRRNLFRVKKHISEEKQTYM